jgi:hypothetical protein
MHAGDTTTNLCMAMGYNIPGTVQELINMTTTATLWSTKTGLTLDKSKRLAKFPKYRTPARSR